MARSTSSNTWLREHVNDQYVQMAKKDGYRARAAYKLLEINEKDKLIRPVRYWPTWGVHRAAGRRWLPASSGRRARCLRWTSCR
jgi:hypothetical protein